ncbi:MAG: hypothetical protein M1827_002737 [Pycnora praestabilis]|nr:MAG: hypothetical protein M1827_002737 [Pycnora praestabilis]
MDPPTILGILARQQDQGDSPADQFLKLVQDPFKSAVSFAGYFLTMSKILKALTVPSEGALGFSRPYNSVVYAPKLKHADDKHRPPPVGRGIFAWTTPLIKTHELELVYRAGLDATVFLRFTRMCRNLFLIMSVVGCGIMIPVNVASSDKAITGGLSAFATMTPMYIFGQALWAHVVCAWAFDIIIAYFLWRNYRAITRLRRQHFESPEYQASLHARTLMVTDISSSYRSDEGILRITDEVNSTGSIPRSVIGRNVKELPDLIQEHNETVRELESVLAKYLKNPDKLPPRPTCKASKGDSAYPRGQRVDAIEYLSGRIRDLEVQIYEVRLSIDKRNAMPYGFASYDSIAQAHMTAYSARNKHAQGAVVKLAPRPNDLIWDNLPLSKGARRWRTFTNNLWVALLTVVWIAPNAMIAIFLSNLSNLGLVWPAFHTQLEKHATAWSIVQGVASPAIMSGVYLLLPMIFRRLSSRAGDLTKTSRDQHVTHKLYAFFVFNNLIVFTAFSAMWQFVSAVISAKSNKGEGVWDAIKAGEFFIKIMTALCTVSPYWVTWVLQRNLGATLDLSQLVNLIYSSFARTFMNPTPRQFIEWTAPPWFDYASYYNYFLFYSTIALCFATLQPIILPVTALYFTLDSWLKKYLLMYVFITKNESGGQFWRILYNRFVFASILANIIIALVVKARGTWTMVFSMAPLPVLMLLFKWYCSKTFDDQIYYYTKATMGDTEALDIPSKSSKRNDRLGERFGHPALYKRLITPMVHAKAQHILAQVYRGRLNSEGEYRADRGDINLDSMSQTQPGKTSRDVPPNAPYEIVQESEMDFAYYKNRDEFGNEHGGGGIYGRPEDLVTERSQTPRSFMTYGGNSSPTSSRASSPNGFGGRRGMRSDADGTIYPSDYHSPAYRSESPGPHHGNQPPYVDPDNRGMYQYGADESESQLLNNAATPGIGQIGMDRWRTGGSGYGGVPQGEAEGPLSYDYFRRGRQ